MYELGQALTFEAQFYDLLGAGLPGITVTCNVFAPDGTLTVSAGATTDRGQGVYRSILAAGSNTQIGEWLAVFTTTNGNADLKDLADRQLVVTAGVAAIHAKTTNLPAAPAAVGSAMGAVASVAAAVTVGTNNDKTGYALTSAEHTLISGTDTPAGLIAQGYTATRAGYLDTLNGLAAAIWGYATRTLSAFGFSATLDAAYDAAKTAASQASVTNIHADLGILLGGGGNRSITLQLYRTGTTTPIADVVADVRNGADEMAAWRMSSAGGQCVLYLADGTYAVRLRKTGVVFSTASITVTADATVTLHGAVQTIPVPTVTETCTVYEYCFDQASGAPVASVTATAQIVRLPYSANTKLHAGDAVTGTYSAQTGLVSWEIVRGATVQFVIKEVGIIALKVVIPAQTTARLSSLEAA